MNRSNTTLCLRLNVHKGTQLRQARVRIRNIDSAPGVSLQEDDKLIDILSQWDEARQSLCTVPLKHGRYHLVISAQGVMTERHAIQVVEGENVIVLELAPIGARYYYSNHRKQFIDEPDLWAAPMQTDHESRRSDRMARRVARLREVGESDSRGAFHNVHLVRVHDRHRMIANGMTKPQTETAPDLPPLLPVAHIDEKSIVLIYGTAYVRFRNDLQWSDIQAIAGEYGIKLLHSIHGDANAYAVSLIDIENRDRIVDVCNTLVESAIAESAEPYTVANVEPLAIVPTDFLRPEQWNLDTVKLFDAWQALRDYSQNVLGVGQADAHDITYGRPDIVISIFDQGIPSQTVAGVTQPVHPDFIGNVKNGSNKVYGLFEFCPNDRAGVLTPMPADNDNPEGSHGVHCAGIAGALTALNGGGGVAEGTVGALPNGRLIGGIWANGRGMTDYHFHRAWEYLAALDPQWVADGALYANAETFFGAASIIGQPGADILSNSYTVGVANADAELAVNNVVCYGRNRRGALFMFAAANNDADMLARGGNLIGNHRRLIIVAASTLDHEKKEIRASYSNFHSSSTWFAVPGALPGATLVKPETLSAGVIPDRIGIDFAAPSHNFYEFDTTPDPSNGWAGGHAAHNPPENRGVYAAGLINTVGLPPGGVNDSNSPGNAQVSVLALTAAVADPATGVLTNIVTVNNDPAAAGLVAGMALLIGDPGANNDTESAVIAVNPVFNPAPVNTIVITLQQPLKNPHAIGAKVYFGANSYSNNMGGTSAACPLAAGIAGLVLSAKPTLTNYEVREILRGTAVPIDLKENFRGPWRGTDPTKAGTPNSPANPLLPMIDANALLNIQGPNTTLAAATVAGDTRITVAANRNQFHKKQAILIGAEARITATAATTIDLDSIAGFAIGQTIRIRPSYSTYFAGLVFPAAGANHTVIAVGNTRGFANGDQINIGAVPYTIANVANSLVLTLTTNYTGPNNWPRIPEIPVTLIQTETAVITAIDPAHNRLTIGATTYAYGAGTVVQVEGTEVTIIKDLPAADPTALIVEPLVYDHAIAGTSIPVQGGLVPFYSNALGFGRIDAAAAVTAALAYSHNDRDLMVRNALNDNGSDKFVIDAAHPVSSPDIWVRNFSPTDPGEPLKALPAGYPAAASYALAGPNQNPVIAGNRWIYARVKNRGGSLESLDAAVRFYITLKHKNGGPIAITDFKQSIVRTLNAGGIPTAIRDWKLSTDSTTEGTEYLGESFVYATPTLPRGIAPGATYVTNQQWLQANTPPVTPAGVAIADRMRVFALAEIIPHDGVVRDPVTGNMLDSRVLGENNNITYKELTFATVTFKQTSVLVLPATFDVKRAGGESVLPFRIEINDQIGLFPIAGVQVVISRRNAGGAETTVTYGWTGVPVSAWQPDSAQAWATADAPKILAGAGADTAAPAGSDQIGVYVAGTVAASKTQDQITLTIRLYSYDNALLLEEKKVLGIQEIAVNYHDLEIKSPDRPDIHFFAEASKLDQSAARAFGPVSDTVFRLTSGFTSDCNGTDAPRVYAAATGILMVQRILGLTGAADPNRVNVIIKPIRQTALGFTPVKYFIYRGVSLTELLSSDGSHVRDRATAGPSPFISEFYADLDQRISDFDNSALAASRPALRPDPNPTSIALGYDTSHASTDPLSKYFHDSGAALQLPLITRGMDFGCFYSSSSSDEFGFEIVLEGTYEPKLADVQTDVNTIDITSYVATNPPTFDLKRKKEVVLSYLDPAAYFGMHWSSGIYTREAPATTSSRTKEQDLYTNVISRFATKNAIWLDIRNENGYSFNYYDNYNPNDCQIRTGSTLSDMVSDSYDVQGWPLMLLQRTAADVQKSNGGSLYVSFHTGDNEKPTVYIEAGKPFTKVTNDVFVATSDLLQLPDPWSREIGFKVQTANDTVASATLDVATVLKFFIGRGIVATPHWANNSVIRVTKFTDNLFGPVDAASLWNVPADIKTEWVSLYDRKVVDGLRSDPDQPFADVVERGVAFQQDQVIFFGAAVGYLQTTSASTPIGKGVPGGFTPNASFLDGSALFDGYEIGSRKITDTPASGVATDINVLTLVPRDGSSLPEGFLLMALKKTMVDDLAAAAATALSPDHQKNLILEEQFPTGGGNFSFAGKNYHRYSVKVRGLDATTFASTDVGLATGEVLVYSDDGLFFTSAAIDTSILVPTTYSPDPEELLAVDKSEPTEMINVDSAMVTALDGFVSAVDSGAIPDDASARAALQTEVEHFAGTIWTTAKTYRNNGVPDDRPLYWARLRMLVALKQHPHMLSNKADRDALVKLFEWKSRGLSEVDFTGLPTGTKKILISGFDPFQLNAVHPFGNIRQSNPSGAIALALNGATITGSGKTAYVQSVIVPVRYRDFDNGLLDEFFGPYFAGPNKVDMVITMSMNGGEDHFDIERFAGRMRGGQLVDNAEANSSGSVGIGSGWLEFFETTLPVAEMMSDVTLGSNQKVFFDQSYSLRKTNGGKETTNPPSAPVSPGPNMKSVDAGIDVKTGVEAALEGSGGNYLSNEIFYRVAHLRETLSSTMLYGHLHVPGPEFTKGALSLADIISKTQTIIQNALAKF